MRCLLHISLNEYDDSMLVILEDHVQLGYSLYVISLTTQVRTFLMWKVGY